MEEMKEKKKTTNERTNERTTKTTTLTATATKASKKHTLQVHHFCVKFWFFFRLCSLCVCAKLKPTPT